MAAAFWPLAFMGLLFAVLGSNLPYMPVWYEKVRGLNGAQIGLALALALMARVATGPVITAWAEGLSDPRRGYAALAGGLLLAFAAAAVAPGFASLAIAVFCIQTFVSALMPFAESAALLATRTGPISYGMGRALGSSAFIAASLGVGFLMGRYGPWAAWIWAASAAAILPVAILRLPAPLKRMGDAAPSGFRARLKDMSELLRAPNFVRLLAGASLIQAGHAFFYNFGSLVWLKQGLSSDAVGFAWALGVACEIVMLTASGFVFRGRRAEHLLIWGGLVGIVRWSVLAAAPSFAVILLMQTLHAGSFALAHVAAMKLVDRMAGDRLAAGQTLYFSVSSGMFTGCATLGSGWLYQSMGAKGFGAMAVLCAAGALLAASALSSKRALKSAAH